MRVRVDADRCQGHTMCSLVAPDAFDLDEDDGHSTARFEVVPPDQEDAVRSAARNCPEQAISIWD